MTNLKGKKILFISPKGSCAHYSFNIVSTLQSFGAFVDFYDERPSQSSLMKVIIKKFKKTHPQYYAQYIKYIIFQNRKKDYDYVWIIRGEGLMPLSFSLLRNAFPNARFILYMWDVLAAVDVKEVIPLFDKVYSFDPEDSARFDEVIFKPTFYIDTYKKLELKEAKYDVFFAGSIYANRYAVLNGIKKSFHEMNIKSFFYFYLPSRLLFIRNYLISNRQLRAKYSDFMYSPLTYDESLSILPYCKAVLDIRYSSQSSLSMRAFEALGAKMKYITNNPEIRKYDFYNENNIFIIEDSIDGLDDFLDKPFVMPSLGIYNKYSLSSWIRSIMNN